MRMASSISLAVLSIIFTALAVVVMRMASSKATAETDQTAAVLDAGAAVADHP
jgi:hypothetical protein